MGGGLHGDGGGGGGAAAITTTSEKWKLYVCIHIETKNKKKVAEGSSKRSLYLCTFIYASI